MTWTRWSMERSARRIVALFITVAHVASAQSSRTPARDSARPAVDAARVTKMPGGNYEAGWLHRLLLGDGYRALWATPIDVDMLDLELFGGGIHPTQRGGGEQTKSLRFANAAGREFVFRPLEKDVGAALPADLRETFVRDLAQDQQSGYHPAASLVVARLLDAMGIRHAQPTLVVLPDSPRLGDYRAQYAGLVGTIEERPGPGFAETAASMGAVEVISSAHLFERLQKTAGTRVDARAYLAARLFDVLVGDRDRHRDQWRWGRFAPGDDAMWEPIPRDRDMPFVRSEGVMMAVVRNSFPQIVTFDSRYPKMIWLNWSGREIDRRLLVGLERPVWDSVAATVRRQVTDSVIDDAVARMPRPLAIASGPELRSALIDRRDHLGAAASEYYALLAQEVDVSATDRRDIADVTRLDDGSLELTLTSATGGARVTAPYFKRRFDRRETREVRLYLHDGDDRAIVHGAAARGVELRIIGGGGSDEVIDSTSAGDTQVRVYDRSASVMTPSGADVSLDRRRYERPPSDDPQNPQRDWGQFSLSQGTAGYAPGIGVTLGASHTITHYGFRREPFATRSTFRLATALGVGRFRASYEGELHPINSTNYATVSLSGSGFDLINFFGVGNETTAQQRNSFYRAFQNRAVLQSAWTIPFARRGELSLGAVGQFTSTREEASTLLASSTPYGSGRFTEAGARGNIMFAAGDREGTTAPSAMLSAGTTVYPALMSVEHAFTEAHASMSTRLRAPMPLEPTLALRATGRHLWGTFPFHDAAFVGGESTVRGWPEQRFAGRSSVVGNAELRLFLTRFFLLVPGDLGVFGLADAGRVYADGERSDAWHTGVGGGVWIAILRRANTMSLSVARGAERTAFYLRNGFAF